MKTLLRKWFGCSKGCCWTGGKHFDFSTIRGQLRWRWHCQIEWIRDLPRSIRWRLSARLAFWASRLFGSRTYDIGYGIEANLAGMLEDRVRMWLVMEMVHRQNDATYGEGDDWKATQLREEADEINELLNDLNQLAGLAKASTWVEYWKLGWKPPIPERPAQKEHPEFDY